MPAGTTSVSIWPASTVAPSSTTLAPDTIRYFVTRPAYQSSPGATKVMRRCATSSAGERRIPGGRASTPYRPVVRSSWRYRHHSVFADARPGVFHTIV